MAKTLDELWNEYQDKKDELEEKFIQQRLKGKKVDDSKIHSAMKRLYDRFYNRSTKMIESENKKNIKQIEKENNLLKKEKGKFYEPPKEDEQQ